MRNLTGICFLAAVAISGCAWQEPLYIAQPPGPSTVVVVPAEPQIVVKSEAPVVAGSPPSVIKEQTLGAPRIEVWRPDPTAGIIHNYSRNIFVKLWIDSRPPTPPTIELGPEQAIPVHVPFGRHILYGEGQLENLTYGWFSVGTMSRTFEIRNTSFSNGYAWSLYISDGDFIRW